MTAIARGIAVGLLLAMPGTSGAVTVVNPGFEFGDGLSGWTTAGGVSVLSICASSLVGCAPDGGQRYAQFNSAVPYAIGTSSIEQTVILPEPGDYDFGVWVALATLRGTVDLEIASATAFLETDGVGREAAIARPQDYTFSIVGANEFLFTDWFMLGGTLSVSAHGPLGARLGLTVQGTEEQPLFVTADNFFITQRETPQQEPDPGPGGPAVIPLAGGLPFLLSGLAVLGIAGLRRRQG